MQIKPNFGKLFVQILGEYDNPNIYNEKGLIFKQHKFEGLREFVLLQAKVVAVNEKNRMYFKEGDIICLNNNVIREITYQKPSQFRLIDEKIESGGMFNYVLKWKTLDHQLLVFTIKYVQEFEGNEMQENNVFKKEKNKFISFVVSYKEDTNMPTDIIYTDIINLPLNVPVPKDTFKKYEQKKNLILSKIRNELVDYKKRRFDILDDFNIQFNYMNYVDRNKKIIEVSYFNIMCRLVMNKKNGFYKPSTFGISEISHDFKFGVKNIVCKRVASIKKYLDKDKKQQEDILVFNNILQAMEDYPEYGIKEKDLINIVPSKQKKIHLFDKVYYLVPIDYCLSTIIIDKNEI